MGIDEIDLKIKELEKKISDPDLCKNTFFVYMRVLGYYRPVCNFNIGKKQEKRI
jgi:hypothetical protein